MPAGGERRGSGRPKGSQNKRTLAHKYIPAPEVGELPLEYMVRVMNDPSVDNERRDKMAIAAAPYYHQKLATVEHTGKYGAALIPVINLTIGPESSPLRQVGAVTQPVEPEILNGYSHAGYRRSEN
jgi:hypothetical protein